MSGGIVVLGAGGQSITTSNGTYNHPNGTSEQDVTEILNNIDRVSIVYDVSALTVTTTIRTYERTDGTNYEIVSEIDFPTDFDANVENIEIELIGKNRDQRVTFQSSMAEGAARSVPFSRVNELRSN